MGLSGRWFSTVLVAILVWAPALVRAETKPEVLYLFAGPLLYLAAVLLAQVNTLFAIFIYLLIPVLYFFAGGIEET